jgi:hypothetical protein
LTGGQQFFPPALAPREILAAKLRSPSDQDAGLPSNVSEDEDNADEEEFHKMAQDQQLL